MKITREFKIGAVALVAVALAIWGINFLKGINVFSSTDRYYAEYADVKGVIESAVVYLNGYKVGNVHRISFDRKRVDRIIIEIALEEKVKLPVNTRLVIRSSSLISGIKDLDLVLGDGPGFYIPGDTLPSGVQVELTDYIDPIRVKVESLITVVDSVIAALHDFLDPATRENLQGTVANLNQATAGLRTSLKPEGSLSRSFSNLAEITANLKRSNQDIKNLLNNLSSVSDSLKQSELKSLVRHADETFMETSELIARINKGEGTAGQLVTNDSLYNNLNSALASLDSLLIDLRTHPKRYVQISVFGKKDR